MRIYKPDVSPNQEELLRDALQFYAVTNNRLNDLQQQQIQRYLSNDDTIMYPDIEHVLDYYQPLLETSANKYNDPDAKNDLDTLVSIKQIIPSVDRAFDKGLDFESED